RAIIETGFTQPYSLLLRELRKEQEQLKLDRQREAELVKEIRHFAYIVSHDLRAPLVNLTGFSAELKTAVEELRPAVEVGLPLLPDDRKAAVAAALKSDIPESLDFIANAVERMDHLIGAILNLSRLGYRQLELEPLDMNDIVRRTLETLAYQINQRGITVSVGELPEIMADRVAMEQIYANLLGNAVNYLDPARPGLIEVTGERLAHETIFRMRDNGIGIAKDDQEKIFEIFQRAGTHNVPGEGMGLAYVRTLVRRHGGRIWVESEPGEGSTFVFTISHQIAGESPGT
ncbi:MAG: histidine kinase, partial [Desulfomonile sp.]|nr:histidine kinase [Desulfomonile sp.]